jgi:hypothetical protein
MVAARGIPTGPRNPERVSLRHREEESVWVVADPRDDELIDHMPSWTATDPGEGLDP